MKNLDNQLQNLPLGLIVACNTVLTIMFGFGVKGALSYTPWMVKVAMAGYALKIAVDLVGFNPSLGLIVSALFVYPQVYFVKEMESNIMTPDNYPNKAQCCC
jgi:hypothetical protein